MVEPNSNTAEKPRPATGAADRKRLRAWQVFALLAGAVVIVGVFLLLGLRGRWERRLQATLDEIRARGEPLTAQDLYAFQLPETGRPDLTEEWIAALAFLDSEEFKASASVADGGGVGWGMEIDPVTRRAVNAFFAQFGGRFDRIRELAALRGVARFPIAWEEHFELLLTHCMHIRAAARILQLQASVAVADGDADEAVASIEALFELGDLIRYEPMLISQLVRIAIHAIAVEAAQKSMEHLDLTDEQLARLEHTIGERSYLPELRRCYLAERATALLALNDPEASGSLYTLFSSLDMELDAWLANGVVLSAATPLWSFNKPADVALFMELMTDAAAAADQPPHLAIAEIRAIDERLMDKISTPLGKVRFAATASFLPALGAAQNAVMRMVTHTRATAVACAALRVGDGVPPATLEELAAAAPELNVTDPWSGQPLKYRVSDGVLTIYSVGADGQDNGGVDGRFNGGKYGEPDSVIRIQLRTRKSAGE